jgi:thioredoxin reductase (NADPH)
VLAEAGEPVTRLFVVRSGRLEAVRPAVLPAGIELRNQPASAEYRAASIEALMASFEPGTFTGEASLLSGRRGLGRIRVVESGEVIEVERTVLLDVVQTDSELSEILMRAFILRRVELLERAIGDTVVLGSVHCPGTLRISQFLRRNGHPHAYIDLDHEPKSQEMLESFAVSDRDLPIVVAGGVTLRNPSNRALAEALGYNEGIDQSQVRDLVIVGAGPAGLAAAVYAASEGLDVLVLESSMPGGQAGESSKIENYLGFPTGISGEALAGRAYAQAQKFKAQVMVGKSASKLLCETRPYAVEMDDGTRVHARAVIIATGAQYRRIAIENLSRFEGAGVYYAATGMEAQICSGQDVVVVGGGNSAGQAAVHLAETARRVYVLVRSSGLRETMSRYLIRRIEGGEKIELHTHTEIVSLEGGDHLERVRFRNGVTGEISECDIRHLFLMTGAVPATGWLRGCLSLDAKGFVQTGPAIEREELEAAHWPLSRPPHLLETSLPGVFAVGDVRCGNVKRVASAVGEGSIAISFVHQVLVE